MVNPNFIGKVRVVRLDHNDERSFVGMYDEKSLISISSAAPDVLKNLTGAPKEMTIKEVDKDLLKDIIETAINRGKSLRLFVDNSSMLDVICILDIVNVLGIIPKQPQVEGVLVHKLTHSPISPQAIVTIHTLFGALGKESRPWRVMVHQLAWDVAHSNLTEQRQGELNTAASKFKDLDNAVMDRIEYLQGCMEHKEQKLQQKATRQFKQGYTSKTLSKKHKKSDSKSSNESRKNVNAMVKQHKQALQEKKEQVWFEEEHGLRATSEETVEYLKHERPTGFWVTPKVNQRQRKMLERVRREGDVKTASEAVEGAGEEDLEAEGAEEGDMEGDTKA